MGDDCDVKLGRRVLGVVFKRFGKILECLLVIPPSHFNESQSVEGLGKLTLQLQRMGKTVFRVRVLFELELGVRKMQPAIDGIGVQGRVDL